MRHYEAECLVCGRKTQVAFAEEPYPEFGERFLHLCSTCGRETEHGRTMTKKTAAELRRRQAEKELRDWIASLCSAKGFVCRFLHESVIITTELSDWCFDYHRPAITLYHESTIKINFETGNYAKAHIQFKDRKMTIPEVVDYIAAHDRWRKMNE